MPSPATASVTHTEPGGDSQVKKKPHVISESALSAAIPIHELPRHIQPSPKAVEKNTTAVDQSEAVEKNTTAVDQSEGLQNMSVRVFCTKVITACPWRNLHDFGIPAYTAFRV